MNMTDLRHIFDAAVSRSKATNREDLPDDAHRDAGIRAVVEALRDEMVRRWSGPDDQWIKDHVVFDFNEILGGSNDAG